MRPKILLLALLTSALLSLISVLTYGIRSPQTPLIHLGLLGLIVLLLGTGGLYRLLLMDR
jgi:hypothetical protein